MRGMLRAWHADCVGAARSLTQPHDRHSPDACFWTVVSCLKEAVRKLSRELSMARSNALAAYMCADRRVCGTVLRQCRRDSNKR